VATIRISGFGGVVPRYHPALLRENMASEAENVRLWHGTLAPYRMPLPVHTAPGTCVRTMHRLGCCWLTWEDPCVDVAEWALRPHTLIGAIVDGQYLAVTCVAAFLFDIRNGIENDGIENNDLMPLTLTPNALHTARDGKLFLAFGNVIHEWDADAEWLPYRWRGRQLMPGGQVNFAVAQVKLDGYPWPARAPSGVRFEWLTDGRVALDRPVRHSVHFGCRRIDVITSSRWRSAAWRPSARSMRPQDSTNCLSHSGLTVLPNVVLGAALAWSG